ncbi:hypothetical protein BST27_16435 [Mycobacterium intermedium]|uniref:Mce protein n=1 Tax=Mycobacterium intermedium TaxID=28445 RepID=A0A1E3SLR5_MYCIE|nr:hypothetical protein [Mycobacterium intermedium]MCV6964783.1 hypothetical protein [Mycobacterium intermedium]ODR03049.1 hypothetical protein BHQ20_01240 [Mycobacterium intermedium]OPE48348.1 hypothetical protein BV508_18450 [Mycobacterium intermedium]ORB02394.1 hypothetical protein BST27_16435 [Mycobacterium intermedium]
MADTDESPTESAALNVDALTLAEQAEAEAAEAEALAAAARARARAARLRREAALGSAEGADDTGYSDIDEEDALADETLIDEDEDYEDDDYYDDADGYDEAEGYEEEAEEAEPVAKSWRDRLRVPRPSTIAKAVTLLVILGFVGISTYIVWKHHEATEREQRAAAFVAGAKQGVVNMTSLDFNKAKEDVQRVIDSSTGDFKSEFQARAADFTKVVEQSKVVTEGTVNAAAIESMDGHTAVVLVSATSRVTNSAGAKDEPRAWRLRVTVTEEDGQYKMSKVEFVP